MGATAAGSVSASTDLVVKEMTVQARGVESSNVEPEATPAAVGMAALTGAAGAIGAAVAKDVYDWGKEQLFGSSVSINTNANLKDFNVIFDK
ncbi:hypothetical protein GXN76_04760 [Kroppenstedtia pulmonis]|uniref:Uncharacterized protein n=1 Tax=Kroppenstedtia pulmonis TaxID=1380685 RepID=A0A7D4BGU0_9BACL|nr:hypothetical protein [Kroppenstedtia pulmonis]QKG83855.1 hypothetical protein GXN76_04760 [Kroppenstedtia pulmonis]